jgi:hypothetical protein
MPKRSCKTCLIEHDEEIHEATVSLHAWLRDRIQWSITAPQKPELPTAA